MRTGLKCNFGHFLEKNKGSMIILGLNNKSNSNIQVQTFRARVPSAKGIVCVCICAELIIEAARGIKEETWGPKGAIETMTAPLRMNIDAWHDKEIQ